MGHSSPKLIASQRLTVSLRAPCLTGAPLSLFSHSNPFHSSSIIFSFSSRLFLFFSRSPHRILLTYIVLDIYPTSIYVYIYIYTLICFKDCEIIDSTETNRSTILSFFRDISRSIRRRRDFLDIESERSRSKKI